MDVAAALVGVVLLVVVLALIAFPIIAFALLLRTRPPLPPTARPTWTDDDEIAARHHR